MTAEVFADQVVIGLLHYAKTNAQKKTFLADREKLHRAFFNQKKKHSQALACLRFRNRGLFEESAALDQALANLEASLLLTRQNQTPRFYEIQPELDKAFDSFVKNELETAGVQLRELEAAAVGFAAEI